MFILLIVIFLVYFTSCFKIDSNRLNFVDNEGRTLILHGVNVVSKLPPYIPTTDKFDPFISLSNEDIIWMKKLGFNFVRYGVIWESIEKTEGEYDYIHLEKVERIINMLGENGIYVLLDAHQDMFSRLFCGEGVPKFYAKNLTYDKECKDNFLSRIYKALGLCLPLSSYNWRYDDNGLPLIEDCKNFMKYHQSPELTTIYNSFYDNQNNIQEKFINFWKTLATKFKNNPYIIGFDIWNEPWPGKLWSNIKSFLPGYSTNKQVLPFFSKIDKELRKIKVDYNFFFEAVPFPDTLPFFGGEVLGGFNETPAGKKYLDKQVLNLHSYCCQAKESVCHTGEPSINDSKLCYEFHRRKVEGHLNNAKKLGVPFIITEFGACSSSQACYEEMKNLVEHAEESMISWAYWMYKPYGDHTTTADKLTEGVFDKTGEPQEVKIKALSRSYVQKYQGTPIFSKFYPEDASYFTSFRFNKNITEPSVLYLNKDYFYREGYVLRIFDENNKDININLVNDSNYIQILMNDEKYKDGDIINLGLIREFNSSDKRVSYKNSNTKGNLIEIIGNLERFELEVEIRDLSYKINFKEKVNLPDEYVTKLILSNSSYKIQIMHLLGYHVVVNLS